MHHLAPNSILHISIFVHLCEAFLGIEPHFDLFCYFFHLKPHPNESKIDVVGGAGLQFRQEKKPQYIPYELSAKVIDWKEMWFYVRNLSSSLPVQTLGSPMKKPNWNSRGDSVDQVNFLLREIERLKVDHQITGTSMIVHWTLRRIQPLQRQVHLGFQYTGEEDPTRYTRAKISEANLKGRVDRLLKNAVWKPSISGMFRSGRHPREILLRVVDCSLNRVLLPSSRVDQVSVQINPKNYQSRPPLPEVAPKAHTDSSVPLTTFALLFC